MYDLLLIFSILLFYFLGRYAGRETEILSSTQKALKKRFRSTPGGVITYATPADLKFEGSERQKINQKAEELLRSVGLK
mgnify:CR=1 FL=1|jgi:hypothetical protein